MCGATRAVRFGPKADSCTAKTAHSITLFGSKIPPPPFGSPLLDAGEPAAGRIKSHDDRQPHRVDTGEAKPIAGRFMHRPDQRREIADQHPSIENGEHVEQEDV